MCFYDTILSLYAGNGGGRALCISGGKYELCNGSAWMSCGKKCDRAEYAAETAGEGKGKQDYEDCGYV